MSLLFGLWPLLMSCLGVFAVTPAARENISKDSTPRHNSPMPLGERSVELQKYQDFKRGLLYGSLVLVYSSLKNDSFRLCMMTYKPNTNLTTEGQIDLLTSSRNSSYREMVQGFDAETARRHNKTYRAIAWLFRGQYYKSRVIFTDYKHCIILRTRGYNNLCELFTAGRHDSDRVNSWCFFIYTVFCGKPAVTFKNLYECWPKEVEKHTSIRKTSIRNTSIRKT
uniref:Putative salivary lipocalin n=1 Tax=Ixodes ricinus TaxID=34613 RepID=A0A147BWT5_IXORI